MKLKCRQAGRCRTRGVRQRSPWRGASGAARCRSHARARRRRVLPSIMAARHKTPKEREAAKGKVSAKALGRAKGRAAADTGELIGRRVGRSAANLEVVLAKPRRSRDLDPSKPGSNTEDKRAGGASTARRNVKRRAPHAT